MKLLVVMGPPLAFSLYAFGIETTFRIIGFWSLCIVGLLWLAFVFSYIGGGLD